ncbi:succinylglutamate desuccinylase/aspartoacylase family protein [Mesorhizobium sp. M0578]|uniref:M14 family zinc carboxypeptidase n=1 Tax=unclassified Mesorhizobium TaxID=325217 RepID=UPI003338F5B0
MKCVTENLSLAASSIGTQRHIVVHRFGAGHLGPKIYFQAGLHADEPAGMVILHHLVRLLNERSDEPKGEIVIVPCANPIGLSQRLQGYHAGRSDLGVGGNFNRNFPDVSALVRERLIAIQDEGATVDDSAIERVLRDSIATLSPRTELNSMKQSLLKLAIDSDYVLDLHTDDEGIVYTFVSDADHPAADLLSQHTASKVTVAFLPSYITFSAGCYRPWRVASEQVPEGSTARRFAATLECRGTRDVSDQIAMNDARGLMGFVEAVGILAASGNEAPVTTTFKTTLECIDYVQANTAGVILFSKAPGDAITVGEEVATILDPTTGDRCSLLARSSGIVIGHAASRISVPGLTIVTIASSSPLPKGDADPFP